MPSTLMDYDNDRFKGKSKLSKPRRRSKGPRGKEASKGRLKEFKKKYQEKQGAPIPKKYEGKSIGEISRMPLSPEKVKKVRKIGEVEKARNMLKKMGESGPEIRRSRQKDRARKAGMILADNDTQETEAGSMDDDATERIKKKKKMLEEAAG
jgi:hypothetical protein